MGGKLSSRLEFWLRFGRLYWRRAERKLALTESQRLFGLTILIGGTCGLVAVAFHLAIKLVEGLAIDRAKGAPGGWWIAWTIITPTLGGLLSGALLYYVVPNARGSGIPQVKAAFALRNSRLRFRDSVGKFGVAAIQIGTGSSLGREGPTVQICAGVASLLGRFSGVSPRTLRRLLPVGAAAGIAAAFNAPIAAVTFTIEEIVGTLDQTMLSGVIVAAALAAVIERSILGEQPVLQVTKIYGLEHPSSLLVYAALGIAASFVSTLFTDSLVSLRRRFRDWPGGPAWARPAIGGLVTGVLAVVALEWLGSEGITGGGYSTLSEALYGHLAVEAMLGLCSMKIVSTIFSYSSGGAGGVFAPALFVGAMLGGVFGALDIALFNHSNDTMGSFALVGMGAAFSGIIRAPITSVLIIVEMTGGYSLILPLMIANMTAYVIAQRRRPTQIYEALLEQDGIQLHDRMLLHDLESITVGTLPSPDRSFATFEQSTSAGEIARRSNPLQDTYPVVDRNGKVIGVLTNEEIEMVVLEPDLVLVVNAADLMRPAIALRRRDDLRTAYETMRANAVYDLPVLDDDGRVCGFVDEAMIARAYMRTHSGKRATEPEGETEPLQP